MQMNADKSKKPQQLIETSYCGPSAYYQYTSSDMEVQPYCGRYSL